MRGFWVEVPRKKCILRAMRFCVGFSIKSLDLHFSPSRKNAYMDVKNGVFDTEKRIFYMDREIFDAVECAPVAFW